MFEKAVQLKQSWSSLIFSRAVRNKAVADNRTFLEKARFT